MKHQFGQKKASGYYLDPPLHQRFMDRGRRLADKSPMDKLLTQYSAYHNSSSAV
ncbi:hypothetical protein HAX54_044561 [Datura stramonium]|uniref:Uncharacterized protein n=1 Tax=Datura stramonium TaxID=4076 RepID=A0ABS8WET1_DATST|nr:hypothetical protein [Datura stramonium]